MEKKASAWVLLSILGSGGSLAGCSKAVAQDQAGGVRASDLDLIVYKQDFAMVHDRRQIDLSSGASEVRLPGVSKMLDPNSVLFDWPGQSSKPEVASTTYNLGVGSSEDLLKRMVGKNVDIVWRGQDGRVGDKASGTLEEAGSGTVLHTKDSYLINPGGEVVAPASQAVTTMPELVATINSKDGGARKVDLSYLTRGLSWSADYVALLAPDAKSMRLECWGTITNLTGTDFPHTKLRLVAGNPNRAVAAPAGAPTRDSGGGNGAFAMNRMAETPSTRIDFATAVPSGELYSYDLSTPANVMQQQMNRAKIFSAEAVPIFRTYSIGLSGYEYPPSRQNAQVSIAFNNDRHAGLGQPMPAGTLRAYDSGTATQSYTGASDVGDTPKNERISLTLSDAFDVYAKARQVARKRLRKHSLSISVAVEIHNEKKQAVDVRVADPFGVSATIAEESVKSQKSAYDSFVWKVPVPAQGKKTLTFMVVLKA